MFWIPSVNWHWSLIKKLALICFKRIPRHNNPHFVLKYSKKKYFCKIVKISNKVLYLWLRLRFWFWNEFRSYLKTSLKARSSTPHSLSVNRQNSLNIVEKNRRVAFWQWRIQTFIWEGITNKGECTIWGGKLKGVGSTWRSKPFDEKLPCLLSKFKTVLNIPYLGMLNCSATH